MGFSRREYWNGVSLPSPIILWRRHISYLHFLKHHIKDLTNVFCKGPNSKHLSLCGSYSLYNRLAIVTPKRCCCWVASVVSDSAWPHKWQPTRLPRPWDSPDKNTGVGCHFLLQCMKVKLLSHVRLFATPWTAAYHAHPPMGFSRQEYWSGVPLPSPNTKAATDNLIKWAWLCSTHSSVLAWRIPGTGEPGGLPSMGSHRVGHDWSDLAAAVF